jgi:hypothetical protein
VDQGGAVGRTRARRSVLSEGTAEDSGGPGASSCRMGESSTAGAAATLPPLRRSFESVHVSIRRRKEGNRPLCVRSEVLPSTKDKFHSFAPIREHVERLNVGRRKSSAIEGRARYERFDETRLFVRILRTIRGNRGSHEF